MATNGQAVGIVSATQGEVFARAADGSMRRLNVGDTVFEGDVIVTANGSSAEISMDAGPVLKVAEQQTVAVDAQVTAVAPDAADGGVSQLGSSEAARVIQTVAPAGGLDINALLEEEAAAAGLAGGDGADGGHSFVDLLRIVEAVPTNAYDFPLNPTGTPPTIEGEVAPETNIEPPAVSVSVDVRIDIETPPDQPPPPPGSVPTDQAPVIVSGNAANLLEGTGEGVREVVFVLSLDKTYDQDVTVTYELRQVSEDGSADYSADWYDGTPGPHQVTIPAGQTTWEVPVWIVEDSALEGNGTFEIVLIDAVNATINPAASSANVTIFDDDVVISANDVTENDAGVTFQIWGPASAESVVVNVGGQDHVVALTNGQGELFIETLDADVYVDPSSVTATVSQINFGQSGTVAVDANATAQIADVDDTTTVVVDAADVTENDAGVTFTFQLSNPPDTGVPASVSVTIGGQAYTVAVDANGYGEQFVATQDIDVYDDDGSITATVTSINGGNFEATSVEGATKTAQIADVDDTTYATLDSDAGGLAAPGTLVTYTVLLSNEVRAGDEPVTVTLTDGVTDYTFQITSGTEGTYQIAVPTSGESTTVSIKSVTQTATPGHSFELLEGSGSETTTIDYPPVTYDNSDWQVQNGKIQPKGQGSITFSANGEIHFDFYVKDGSCSLSLDQSSAYFAALGMSASVTMIYNDSNETVFRVTLINTTDSPISIGNSEQLTLQWSNVGNVSNDVYLINSDEYVLLNNDGSSIKLATAGNSPIFTDSTASTTGDDRFWLSDSPTGQESVKYPVAAGEETVAASDGNDIIYGSSGVNKDTVDNDTISGGAGNDLIDGRAGTDVLDGGSGNDVVFGGYGNDVLIGGAGDDALDGGYGADTFVFSLSDTPNGSVDTVKDFNKFDASDTLRFEDVLSVDISYNGGTGDSTIVAHYTDASTQMVIVEGVQLADAGNTILAAADNVIKITG